MLIGDNSQRKEVAMLANAWSYLEELLGKTVHPNCETSHGFPADVWGTVSSLAFIAGAVWCGLFLYRQRSRSVGAKSLTITLFLAGCASIAWHSTRLLDCLVADVSMSVLCFLVLLASWLEYIVHGRWKLPIIISLLGILGLVLAGVRTFPAWGSAMLIGLLVIAASALALRTWSISHCAGRLAVRMVAVAAFAIVARTLDASGGVICRIVPEGTHWMWHVGMAISATLAVLMLNDLSRHTKHT